MWDSNSNDILPWALANFTNRRVKIFSSKLNTPHWDITPTLTCGQSSSIFSPIYLALVAPRGQPAHYDGCLIRRRSIYTEFGDMGKHSAARDIQMSARPILLPLSVISMTSQVLVWHLKSPSILRRQLLFLILKMTRLLVHVHNQQQKRIQTIQILACQA